MRLKLLLVALLGLALLIGVGGCGGDDGGGSETTPGAAETTPQDSGSQAGQAIDVFLSDFKIEPSNPTIDDPGKVELRITNTGDTEHNLEIEAPNGAAVLPSNLAPGVEKALTVDLSKAGSYEWFCPVANHRDLGMEGQIQIGKDGQ